MKRNGGCPIFHIGIGITITIAMLIVGVSVFTAQNVSQLTSTIGYICFIGWIPMGLATFGYAVAREFGKPWYWALIAPVAVIGGLFYFSLCWIY